MENLVIFWFRRDLRVHDNQGFYHALKDYGNVLPLFIYDRDILDDLAVREDRRINFISRQLQHLDKTFRSYDSGLDVRYGKPAEVFRKLFAQYNVRALVANHDYEPYARKRDEEIRQLAGDYGITFHTYKDQVVFEKEEVVKKDGKPYTVFTPYMKQWKARLQEGDLDAFPSEEYLNRLLQHDSGRMLQPEDVGFRSTNFTFPAARPDAETIKAYDRFRDFPAVNGTSHLSVHFRFGTVSIRRMTKLALKINETWLNELIWREFYMMILWHFPEVTEHAFKPRYDNIPWRNNEQEFDAWVSGKTGYPLVDAGMRELNATGYMHNRLRMVTASFLVKHLLTDWRLGEAYFAEKLLDYELASNNGGWQWAAGSGCDAAPYFRIFNPSLQLKRFDPDMQYIRKWVPEFQEFTYPNPIVEHKAARERALRVYKEALNSEQA